MKKDLSSSLILCLPLAPVMEKESERGEEGHNPEAFFQHHRDHVIPGSLVLLMLRQHAVSL